jgi:hypothetical protein
MLQSLGTTLGTVGQREDRMKRKDRVEGGTGKALEVAFMLSQLSDLMGEWQPLLGLLS